MEAFLIPGNENHRANISSENGVFQIQITSATKSDYLPPPGSNVQ